VWQQLFSTTIHPDPVSLCLWCCHCQLISWQFYFFCHHRLAVAEIAAAAMTLLQMTLLVNELLLSWDQLVIFCFISHSCHRLAAVGTTALLPSLDYALLCPWMWHGCHHCHLITFWYFCFYFHKLLVIALIACAMMLLSLILPPCAYQMLDNAT